MTVTATDPYGNTDTTYSGAKTLTFSGANSSTNPVTAPTVTNNVPTATNFGSATTNTFTNGVSNTAGGVGAMKLYKVETANVAVTDGTIAASTGTDRLTVAVTAAATASRSSPARPPQTAGASQTVTVTATGTYGNTTSPTAAPRPHLLRRQQQHQPGHRAHRHQQRPDRNQLRLATA